MKLRRWLCVSLLLSASAFAGVPDWFRQAAAEPLPAYPADTEAVVLLDEGKTVVKDSGEIRGGYRMVYKILRPQGRSVAKLSLCSDSETRISSLKAWSITAQGVEYEVKEKDAVERGFSGGVLFSDVRCKELEIPGADPGSVVGYEYERKERPYVLEDHWWFQGLYPVRRSRLVLQLPSNWEDRIYWMNHEPVPATDLGNNSWAFELRDLPAIETEQAMPPMRALAAAIGIQYFPPNGGAQHSWNAIGAWAGQLANDRRQPTPAMQQKVAELTANAPSTLDKIRVLAAYVQREVRYVAIEIGIGGYQPHLAGDVFANRWGDCKDKATLLSTMLRLGGIESNLVLLNTRRGIVVPEHPFVTFNHAILAIRMPAASIEGVHAIAEVPGIGPMLIFDPTDDVMALGNLPGTEQANYGLIVTDKGGVLVKLPVLPPEDNRLDRSATLTIGPAGSLTGQVRETYTGSAAKERRARLRQMDPQQRKHSIESFLAVFLPSADVTDYDVKDLDQLAKPLTLTYSFTARNYAKPAGSLLLVRPRVLGEKAEDTFEDQHKRERRYPVEFDNLSLQTDHVEITLPAGYVADEVPDPISLDPGPVSYRSKVEIQGNVLRYDREYRVKDIHIGADRLQELKRFYRQLAGEEQNAVVLKRQP